MKTIFKTLLLILIIQSTSLAQQGSVGIGTTSPDPSAILDLVSTEKGLLIPRMTTQQITDILNAPQGLLIYDTEAEALCTKTINGWEVIKSIPDGNPNDYLTIDNSGKLKWKPILNAGLSPEPALSNASNFTIGSTPTEFVISQSKAYIVDRGSQDLKIVDLSDPESPILLGARSIGPSPSAIAVVGNIAIVTDRDDNDIRTYNVSDPSAIEVLDSFSIGDFPSAIDVYSHYAIVTDRTSDDLKVFDIQDPSNISVVYDSPSIFSNALQMFVQNNLVYVNDSGTLRVFDISNPISPNLLGTKVLGGGGGNRISNIVNGIMQVSFFGQTNDNVKWFDVSNVNDMKELSTIVIGAFPISNVMSGKYGVMIDNGGGNPMFIFDVSDPSNPTLKDQINTPVSGKAIIEGNYLFAIGANFITSVKLGEPQSIGVNLNGEFVEVSTPQIDNKVNEITDSDEDTKIKVEASTDEDVIRFEVGGTEKMRITPNGFLGIGTDNPTQALHVKGDEGLNGHIARIQNTNPNGSGLVIQIDGKHPMLLPGDIFPPKIPTPLEYLVQPIATKIKERILDGEPFKAPTIDDFLDIVNGVIDPNAVNMLRELGLDQLVLAAACDGTEYLSSMVQFPDLDIGSINAQLPNVISNLPRLSEATIDLPNFPSNLGSFSLPNGVALSTTNVTDFFGFVIPVINGVSLSYETYTIPSPPNLPNITIPAFDTWNNLLDSRDIDGDLEGILSGFNNLKNQMSSKFSAGNLLISDNLNCTSLPDLSNIEITLPDFSDLPKESVALDERNHFVTFVDEGQRELGAIKAQHPADYAISQLSTANVLEIGAIIPGIISDDGNIVENIVNLAGFGYQWVEGYNSIGVSYESSFGDYAEWLPKANQKEEISYGDVIGIKGGFISKDLTEAEQVMVVSKAPIIMGNAPDPERLHEGKNIAFIGQVPVKAMGPVKSGDFIVADLNRAGFAKAIHPENMTPDDHQYTVGRSWDNDDSEGFKFVNTLVGMHNNAWAKPMKKMQKTMEKMDSRLTAIEDQLSNIDLNKN